MEYRIRPFKESDVEDINEMRTMPGVMETIPTLTSESVSFTRELYTKYDPDFPAFCAVVDTPNGEKVIGHAMLVLYKKARLRHVASVAIIVNAKYQDMGVGRALLSKLLDIADNWLMLVRVELEVQAENARAVHLYQSLGFQNEGLIKYAVMQNGKYRDIIIMGRYNMHEGAFDAER
ncbi:MAG: GNAT family N-acetyltransferase [Cloacibacillus sp.]